MASDKGRMSHDDYVPIRDAARAAGGATADAEREYRQTGKIDPLVDPQEYGVIRRSLPRFEEAGGKFILAVGIPMPIRVRLDTTGSMGRNVDKAFDALPKSYHLLDELLARYDIQIGTDTFNDLQDAAPVLYRSQFEMGGKIAAQLRLMPPGKAGGGNGGEDPQFGLFGGAYLSEFACFNRWGLKGYDLTLTDEPIHDLLTEAYLKQVFGDGVLDKVSENGHDLGKSLPSNKKIVSDLLKIAHAFVLIVNGDDQARRSWGNVFSSNRIIDIPNVDLLPHFEAGIVGLTEGVLDLQTLPEYLVRKGEITESNARIVARALSKIPLRAQADLPGFNEIPLKGARFANKTDAWPIGHPKAEAQKGEKKPQPSRKAWV